MNETYKRIIEMIGEYTDADMSQVNENTQLRADLGLDSFSFISMIDEAESKFNIVIDDKKMMDVVTIGDLAAAFSD